jgi:hypothetical protein
MKQFHCILGNKGGVGKSLAASWLIQYGLEQGWNVLPIECDQGNRTLSRYGRLRTERLELLDPEHQVDRRRFDALLETLVADTEPCVVMDNGQASFAPLTRYMSECLAFDMLRDARRDCFVHTVLAGGQLGASTLAGLRHTCKILSADAKLVVWHNEHFGTISHAEYERAIENARTRVLRPVQLIRWSQPFEDDVQDMLKEFLTFEEALASPNFGLMSRQRLKLVREQVFGALQQSFTPVAKVAVHAD